MSLLRALVKPDQRIPGYVIPTPRSPADQCDTIRQEDGSWISARPGPHDDGIWLNLAVCGIIFGVHKTSRNWFLSNNPLFFVLN